MAFSLFSSPPVLLAIALAGVIAVLILWNKPVIVIYLQIAYPCVMNYLIIQFHFPTVIRYCTDILTLLLFLQLLLNRRINLKVNLRKPFFAVVLFTLVALVPFLMGSASFVYLVWGVRVIYRGYVFFAACIFFLTRRDIDNLLNFIVALLPINLLVCCFQFFIQGLVNDAVSGLFQFNAYLNLHLIVVSAALTSFYAAGKISIPIAAIGIIMVLFTSVLAELKAMFFFVPLVFLIIAVVTFPNKRALSFAALGSIASLLSIPIMILFYPAWMDFFTAESMYQYSAELSYSGSEGLSRLMAGSYLLESVLLTPFEKLFGVGLGNADHYLGFYSPFYLQNWRLYYDVFTYSMLIAEVGLLGLAAYVLFFISIVFDSIRAAVTMPTQLKRYCHITIATSIFAVILMVYNATSIRDFIYMLFFVFAIPYVIEKEASENQISSHSNSQS